jgi:hypothetical protein
MIISWVEHQKITNRAAGVVLTGDSALLPGPVAGGRTHDPQYRLLMAAAAAMSNRYSRSSLP